MSDPQKLAKVGDRIEHGQDIPANVVRMVDRVDDTWVRNSLGHWHVLGCEDPATCDDYCSSTEVVLGGWHPFAVVEVDPVAQPERTAEQPHGAFNCDMGGLPHRGPCDNVRPLSEPQPAEQCDECESTGQNCWEHGGRERSWGEPAGARDETGCLRLKGTATGDNQLDPEPQPAEPVETMSRCQVAQRCLKGMCAPDDECPSDPVLSGPGDREPDEREVADTHLMMVLGVDRLAGAIPAIESLLADRKTLMLVESELGVTRPEDVVSALEKRFNALVLARRSREENRQERLRAEAEVKRLSARLDEATEALTELKPAESSPLVLTLPQVPDGAVALVGNVTGRRYEATGAAVHPWRHADKGTMTLADVLHCERPSGVTVEMAPPREPRVWEQLDPAPDDLMVVEVEGHGRWTEVRTGADHVGFENPGYGDVHSLGMLRELGKVREVLDA